MAGSDETCTLSALLVGEESDCLRLIIGDVTILVEKSTILEIEETEQISEPFHYISVMIKIPCVGSVRRIDSTGTFFHHLAQDPFAICSRALLGPEKSRSDQKANPAYRALVERFLESQGVRPKE